jgi:hypothetical protein
MTADEILNACTPNALEGAKAESLDDLLNHAGSHLLTEKEGVARQIQSAIQAIHVEKAWRMAQKIAIEAKRPHWTVLPNFWFTVIAAVAAIVAVYFAWRPHPPAIQPPLSGARAPQVSSQQKPQPSPASPKP